MARYVVSDMSQYVNGDKHDAGVHWHEVDENGLSAENMTDLHPDYNPQSTFQTKCGLIVGSDPFADRTAQFPNCSSCFP